MKKTTLILGAGVSKAYGYPLGPELVDEIKKELPHLMKQEESYPARQLIQRLDNALKSQQPFSIDKFLHDNSSYNDATKELIAYILLKKEVIDPESLNETNDFYRFFYNHVEFDNLVNYGIISFNYDRSLEFYLSRAISSRLNIKPEEALSILHDKMEIMHVYGRLPALYQTDKHKLQANPSALIKPKSNFCYPYGSYNDSPYKDPLGSYKKFIQYHGANNLKIMGEDNNCNEEAKNLIESSERVFFLGFSYNDLNMQALGFDFAKKHNNKKIMGTSFGMGEIFINRVLRLYPAITWPS